MLDLCFLCLVRGLSICEGQHVFRSKGGVYVYVASADLLRLEVRPCCVGELGQV